MRIITDFRIVAFCEVKFAGPSWSGDILETGAFPIFYFLTRISFILCSITMLPNRGCDYQDVIYNEARASEELILQAMNGTLDAVLGPLCSWGK